MSFNRVLVSSSGKLQQLIRGGDGFVGMPGVTVVTADAVLAVTADMILAGHIQFSGTLTAGRIYTLPTGALMAAAVPDMEIGDSIVFTVTNAGDADFAITVAGADSMTLVGSGIIGRYFQRVFTLVKTGAATFSVY